MNRISLIIITMLMLAGTLYSKDLNTFKEIYEKKVKEINLLHNAKMTEIGKAYADNLETLLLMVKKTGDLNNTKAVIAEIKRFEAEKVMPETLSSLPQLKKLQNSFNESAAKSEGIKANSITAFTEKYEKALEKLQKQYVMTDKLEEAEAVQKERERIKTGAAPTTTVPKNNTTSENTSKGSEGFPEGTFEFRTHHYYRLPLRHNYEEATEICEELGGHILSINSSAEYKYFSDMAQKEKISILLDLNDEKKEGSWKTWNRRTPFFTKWQPGFPKGNEETNSVCINLGKYPDMTDVSSTKSFFVVFCEWEPRDKCVLDKVPGLGLCEIELQGGGATINTLKTGANRLKGLSACFSHVATDLIGAQYTQVSWQSRPTFNIKVTKQGYIFAYKIHEWEGRKNFPFVHVSDAFRGGHHKSGAYRLKVEKDQEFTIKSYEPGIIAAKIIKK